MSFPVRTTKISLDWKVAKARAAARPAVAKDDTSSADLDAGGKKSPQQGNPKPRKTRYQDIDLVLDRPRGFVMSGKNEKTGEEWTREYKVDYGFIPGTEGGDAEDLDVFVGPDSDWPEAYWIVQQKDDGTFDEYKLMLGCAGAAAARKVYFDHVPRRYYKKLVTTSIGMVKALLGIEPVEVYKALELLKAACCAQCADKDAEEEETSKHDVVVKLLKAAPQQGGELRYVLGEVLVPEMVDSQGDIYDEETIRKAAWGYMANFQNVGLMHKGLVNGKCHIVESYIAPVDMLVEGTNVKKGTWIMGVHVADEELWGKIKSGELGAFSIGGFAVKSPA